MFSAWDSIVHSGHMDVDGLQCEILILKYIDKFIC